MARWIDTMDPAAHAELVDAGRIGASRFDGPEFCDKCLRYQASGATRPIEAGSRYRICATCDSAAVDAAVDAYRDAGFDAMSPLQQRFWDGDR